MKEIIDLIKGEKLQRGEDFKKLDDRFITFEKSMTFINAQFENFKKTKDHLLKQNTDLHERNDELSQEISKVKRELQIAKKDLGDLEQYGLRNCIEISGLPQEKNENVKELIMKNWISPRSGHRLKLHRSVPPNQ